MTDRFDPTNADYLRHDRATTVRGLSVKRTTDNDGWAPGHDFRLEVPVGSNTVNSVTLNYAELRRWALILAEAAVRFAPEVEHCDCLVCVEEDPVPSPTCPACKGDIHVDLSGELWPTNRKAES